MRMRRHLAKVNVASAQASKCRDTVRGKPSSVIDIPELFNSSATPSGEPYPTMRSRLLRSLDPSQNHAGWRQPKNLGVLKTHKWAELADFETLLGSTATTYSLSSQVTAHTMGLLEIWLDLALCHYPGRSAL
ncbi:hypothetical protein WAI453_004743 [Rhynchosporium graminicola]